MDTLRLRDLPPYAKTFVGIFTALMLCVCIWATWIYTARYGRIEKGPEPTYLREKKDIKEDLSELKTDSEAVMAPVWDTTHRGEEQKIDSPTMAKINREATDENKMKFRSRFDRDLGLAHTHMNGQTLLFFAIGLVFLFTSVSVGTKKIVYWIFGLAVLGHNVGMSFRSYVAIFADILSISGIVILLVIAYMAFMIFADLAKKPMTQV